jgi:three-Cys-motif partner protein
MSNDHHKWQLGSELPIIRPHSLAKHRVIEQYLRRYVSVLTANPRIPMFCLTLVDGFAGGGRYRDSVTHEERYGSPLLMLQAMQESAAIAQSKRSNPFRLDVEYVFVESSTETFPCLKASLELSEFRALLHDKIKLVNDQFVNQVDPIVRGVQNRGKGNRAIFILDQFGYTDVPFRAIQSILSRLGNAEVILTFATDSLIDYLSDQDSMQRTLEKLGLKLSKDEIYLARQEANWRGAIQLLLHRQIYLQSGAKYYTPFFIRSKDAHRDYWLIHLSNHSRARDVMAELHWLENTSFAHFGRPGLLMLGYDQDHDIQITGQPLLFNEFRFDEIARASTLKSLLNELPERLIGCKDGVTFGDFFSGLTNETPATSEILKAALGVLLREGIIDIRDKTGLVRRQTGIQHRTDVMKPSSQPVFFTPAG